MRHRKGFATMALAGAFAVAALASPAAQAMPPDLPGDQVRALQEAKAKSVRDCQGEDDSAGELAQAADSRV